jgi:signal recognition particle subunit SRP54
MLPGIGKMKKQLDSMNLDDTMFKRQAAIISSMTKQERKSPKVLAASRKKRIAAGSGTSVQEVNKLLKMHRQMADMMKQVSRGKGGLAQMFGLGGGMPEITPDMVEAVKSGKASGEGLLPGGQLPPGSLPGGGLPGLPGMPGTGIPRLPGLGGGGGFAGLPTKGKKK